MAEKPTRLIGDLGGEHVDVRAEQFFVTSIRLSNERFDQATSGIHKGLGVRTLYKGAWGFSSTSSLDMKEIGKAAEDSFKTAKATSKNVKEEIRLCEVKTTKDRVKMKISEPLIETGIDKKMEKVLHLSQIARKYSSKIVRVNIAYDDASGEKAIITSDGARILIESSRISVSIRIVAKESDKIVSSIETVGTTGGFELFKKLDVDEIIESVAIRALGLLKAKPGPRGRLSTIADPKLAGVFAHEAVGHACEADSIIAGESILEGKLGQKIGNEMVSVFDDSTLAGGWGSEKYDDEGVPTKKRVLIERGALRGLINNRESAARLELEPNGGARAESFFYSPVVRMSNTYIGRGNHSVEELLEDIDYGVYLKGARGGEVDSANGVFQFDAQESYLIEKGELAVPLLDVSLTGSILETLHNIDAVGNDFCINVGFCTKSDQIVPVGNASPHIRIKNALVGGRV